MTTSKNAAIVLLGMGESCASDILKILNQKEVEKIISVMNDLQDLSEQEVIKALNEFFKETMVLSGLNVTSSNYIKNTLVNAVGVEKAGSLMEGKGLIEELKGIELLKWQPTYLVRDALKDEHPQIITIVICCLESEKAASLMSMLPKETRTEVIRRMTSLEPLSQLGVRLLSEYLEEYFTKTNKLNLISSDVMEKAANILSRLDINIENEIMTSLSEDNKILSEKLQDKIFPFEKLAQLDKKNLQILLAEVDNQLLCFALKGSDEELQQAFFKAMSSKSADLLKEDMESMGPIKINEVLNAQKQLIEQAKKMASENKILLPSSRKSEVV